jgi:hypothetical protein
VAFHEFGVDDPERALPALRTLDRFDSQVQSRSSFSRNGVDVKMHPELHKHSDAERRDGFLACRETAALTKASQN